MGEGARDFWRVIAAVFLPPVAVFLQSGLGGAFLLNLLLTVLFFVPAQVHAIWVIATTDEHGGSSEGGMTTFVALLLAAWLPPVGVVLKKGVGVPLILNVVLCFLFWIPAIVHAAWVITTDQD